MSQKTRVLVLKQYSLAGKIAKAILKVKVLCLCFHQILCHHPSFLVSRCINMWGPQTSQSEVPAPSSANAHLTPAIQERLQNMEKHLGLTKDVPVPQDVYGRLKALEDRILHLESLSPEYFDGPLNLQSNKEDDEMMAKIDHRMDELRRKLV